MCNNLHSHASQDARMRIKLHLIAILKAAMGSKSQVWMHQPPDCRLDEVVEESVGFELLFKRKGFFGSNFWKRKMKNLLITLCVFAVSLSPLLAEDMQAYLQETQRLTDTGKYKEALERHVWFHDHSLEHERAMTGVRLSFALMYWKELGDVYPPAIKKMEEIRDTKQSILLGGKGDDSLFQDVASLNRILGENRKSIELFKKIESKNNQRAARLWLYIENTVFELGEYDIAKRYVKDFSKNYKITYAGYLRKDAMFKEPDEKDWNRKNFVKKCIQLITVADMTGHSDIALEIKRQALDVVDDAKLRNLKVKRKSSKPPIK